MTVIDGTPQSSRPQLTELNGVRALAILLVIAFHSWYFLQFAMPGSQVFLEFTEDLPTWFILVKRGDVGVDVFFVLSGFLLSWQLFKEQKAQGNLSLRRFYARRVFRIYPLYILALLLVGFTDGFSWKVLGNLFTYNIWLDPFEIIIPWSWSLSVELQFYAIVPLIALACTRASRVNVLVAASAILSIGWGYWVLQTTPALGQLSLIELDIAGRQEDLAQFYSGLYTSMPVRLVQFMAGLGAAWLCVNLAQDWLTPLRRNILVLLSLLGILTPLIYDPYTAMTATRAPLAVVYLIFGRAVFGFGVAAIIYLLVCGQLPVLARMLSARVFELIARFSFSMYLFHPAFVALGGYLIVGENKVSAFSGAQISLVFAVAVLGSAAFGAATWYIVERPAIRACRKWF